MNIFILPKGRHFDSQFFYKQKVAEKHVRAVCGIKRLAGIEKEYIAAAVAKHQERTAHIRSQHPEDYPRYTWEYQSAPKLARQKFITVPYMRERRIVVMLKDSRNERARRIREADREHGLIDIGVASDDIRADYVDLFGGDD